MFGRRLAIKPGLLFTVPLRDGRSVAAEVISVETNTLHSAFCAFTDRLVIKGKALRFLQLDEVVSAQFVTRDLLETGRWKWLANSKKRLKYFDPKIAVARGKAHVGTKVIGSRNIEALLNAYFGLEYWDDFHDPQYLDGLLIDPAKKPDLLMLKSDGSGH